MSNTPFVLAAFVATALLTGCGSASNTSDTAQNSNVANPNAVTSTGAGGGSGAVVSTPVNIVNFAFDPTSATVAAGASIAFTNSDSATHDMAIQSGEAQTADTGSIAMGETKSITFLKAGTYQLYCTIHPSMVMTVTVQ